MRTQGKRCAVRVGELDRIRRAWSMHLHHGVLHARLQTVVRKSEHQFDEINQLGHLAHSLSGQASPPHDGQKFLQAPDGRRGIKPPREPVTIGHGGHGRREVLRQRGCKPQLEQPQQNLPLRLYAALPASFRLPFQDLL